MSRRILVALATLAMTVSALATSFSPAGGGSGSPTSAPPARGADAFLATAVGDASGRIELMRPRGSTGADQPSWLRPIAAVVSQFVPQNGILYHGGPVVMGEKVVAIYWGATNPVYTGGPTPGTTGTAASDGSLIGFYLRNLGGSARYNINTTYTNGSGTPIPNSLTYTGFWANNTNVASDCANVSDTAIQSMITSGFTNGKITYDANTIYTVFSAGKVNLGGGFGNCTAGKSFQYCAYHGSFNWNGKVVLYAAMPYNNAYPGSCTAFQGGGPANGDAGADAEVNTLTHELEEANTDPQLNAWYDSNGNENADKCAWTFGTLNPDGKGNTTIGGKSFLVQRNWLNLNGGSCVQTYGTVTPPSAGTISGKVTITGTSTGISGATVTATGGATTSTDGSGSYTLANLAPNTYSLTVTRSGYANGAASGLTVSAGVVTTANVSLTALAPTTGTISGRVTDAATSAAISGATVTATGGATTSTDGSGNYTLANLAPNTYSLTVTKAGYANGAASGLTVTAGVVTTANVTMTSTSSAPAAASLSASTNARSCFLGIFCNGGGVRLSWNVPAANGSAITGYRIYRSTTSTVSTSGAAYATATSTTYTDSSTTRNVIYYYKVVAVNALGAGADSNVASATAG